MFQLEIILFLRFALEKFKINFKHAETTRECTGLYLLQIQNLGNSKDMKDSELQVAVYRTIWNLCADNKEIQQIATTMAIPHNCYNELIKHENSPMKRILAAMIIWCCYDHCRRDLVRKGITQRFCKLFNILSIKKSNSIQLLPLKILILKMLTSIAIRHSELHQIICKHLKVKILFQTLKFFLKRRQVSSLELYQFHVAETLRILGVVSEKNFSRIKILLKEKVPKILANFFKTTYLTVEIKWRISCLITSLCSLSLVYVGTTEKFIQEFWKEGGVRGILNQLKQEDNYRTMFSLFCALCELTSQKEVLKDLIHYSDIVKTTLVNIYYACNKRALNLNCLDGLLDRLAFLLNRLPNIKLSSQIKKLIISADTVSFLKILALLNHSAFGTSQERFTLHIKYRALEVLSNLIKNDFQSQEETSQWLETFLQHGSQFIYKQFPRFLTALALFFKSTCFIPFNKNNISILNENLRTLRSIYDSVTNNTQVLSIRKIKFQN